MAITRIFLRSSKAPIGAQAQTWDFTRALFNAFIQDAPAAFARERRENLLQLLAHEANASHADTVSKMLSQFIDAIPHLAPEARRFHVHDCGRLKFYLNACRDLLPIGLQPEEVAAHALFIGAHTFARAREGLYAMMRE